MPTPSLVDVWTTRPSAADSDWQALCWSEEIGLFVAVAFAGAVAVMTSPDGETWTARPGAGDGTSWDDICWSPEVGLFVAVSQATTGTTNYRVMTSPDGITWTLRHTTNDSYYCVCWAAELGLFVALGFAYGMTSPDGITWTDTTLPSGQQWEGVCWSPEVGLLVGVTSAAPAVGEYRVITSPDGVTWTHRTEAAPTHRVVWARTLGLFVAIGSYSPLIVQTSPDGITWTHQAGATVAGYEIAWSPRLQMLVSGNPYSGVTGCLTTSPDGVTWTTRTLPVANAPRGIAWSPTAGRFAIVCATGTGDRAFTSPSVANRAEWLAWPTRTIRPAVVLQPNLTLAGWTAVGASAPDTYQIALPAIVLTDAIVGGMYQRCVGVTENETALTAKTSLAAVDAAAGSYWWDEANGQLYVHTTTGSDPDAFTVYFAQVQFFFSNDGRVLELTDGVADTGVPFRPWLPGDLPSVSREVEDFFFGQKISMTTSLAILNTSYAFYRLLANDGAYWWKNTPVRIYLGGEYNGRTLAWSQYLEYLTMLIEDVACDDLAATIQVKPLQRLLTNLDMPPQPYFEGDYPHLGEGVRGRRRPIGYGRATRRPDLTDTTVNYGRWTIADAAYQTLFAVYSVVAIAKSDGTRTTLTLTTHYTVDLTACTVTIVHASYAYGTHDLEVDVAGKPDGAGSYLKTVGQIIRDLLETFVGLDAAAIDTAAFAQADLDAPMELAVWLPETPSGSARTLSSIISSNEPDVASIEGSTLATLKQNRAGAWTLSVWNPGYDANDVIALTEDDFITFSPEPKLETVFPTARVYYNRNHSTDEWSSTSATNDATRYLSKSTAELERRTYLRNASDATVHAQRALFMSGAQPQEVEFVLRNAKLAESLEGDKVLVTRARAMSASGAWVGKACELLRIDLSPMLEIAGRLTDDRGIGSVVGHWKDSTAPDYASATEAERAFSGFWADSTGRVDPSDPKTLNISRWW